MIKKFICFLFAILISVPICAESPFKIDFPHKKNLSNEDYIELQIQARKIDILPLVKEMYESQGMSDGGYTNLDDFLGRCRKGIYQKFIDVEHNLYPTKKLIKIGEGGDRCFVCAVPLTGKYPFYLLSLILELERLNFNGYFLYYIGGYPNPTGEEIEFAAVPYSFKIFAMKEAALLGFTNVLWVDAACYPLREVDSLFEFINHYGCALNYYRDPYNLWRYIFPQTRQLLYDLSGTDVVNGSYINTVTFGLKMNSPQAQKIINDYTRYAQLGTPFLSCFPEEFVLTAIIGQAEFEGWRTPPFLPYWKGLFGENTPEEYEAVRSAGYYFYHRHGR